MLTVDTLWKTYRSAHGDVQASKGLSFSLTPGEVLSLVGPSGCGKTTALRCIAGLETPDSGRVAIGERDLYSSEQRIHVPAHRRPIGMVFQSYAIWPHMTVFDNVAYPLKVARPRLPRNVIAAKTRDALDRVRIPELAGRRATMLSGGQQQRVAIARALVRDAALLLFDEPLSNLDAKLREEMRGELRQLFQSTGVTVLYVTHDLGEALALSDRLLVLEKGEIAQEGRPEDIYFQPRSLFVAEFLGNANLVPARASSGRDGHVDVVSTIVRLQLPHRLAGDALGDVTMLVRPEAFDLGVAVHPDDADAMVEASLFLGSTVEYRLRAKCGTLLTARTASYGLRFQPGEQVHLRVDPSGVSLIPSTSLPFESSQLDEPEREPALEVA